MLGVSITEDGRTLDRTAEITFAFCCCMYQQAVRFAKIICTTILFHKLRWFTAGKHFLILLFIKGGLDFFAHLNSIIRLLIYTLVKRVKVFFFLLCDVRILKEHFNKCCNSYLIFHHPVLFELDSL